MPLSQLKTLRVSLLSREILKIDDLVDWALHMPLIKTLTFEIGVDIAFMCENLIEGIAR
jgi:hypothetical protein